MNRWFDAACRAYHRAMVCERLLKFERDLADPAIDMDWALFKGQSRADAIARARETREFLER